MDVIKWTMGMIRLFNLTSSTPIQEHVRYLLMALFYWTFYSFEDSDNFTLVQERRTLFNGRNASEWIEVFPLVPRSQFVIQVNASNTAGFILSNTLTMDMPPGSMFFNLLNLVLFNSLFL